MKTWAMVTLIVLLLIIEGILAAVSPHGVFLLTLSSRVSHILDSALDALTSPIGLVTLGVLILVLHEGARSKLLALVVGLQRAGIAAIGGFVKFRDSPDTEPELRQTMKRVTKASLQGKEMAFDSLADWRSESFREATQREEAARVWRLLSGTVLGGIPWLIIDEVLSGKAQTLDGQTVDRVLSNAIGETIPHDDSFVQTILTYLVNNEIIDGEVFHHKTSGLVDRIERPIPSLLVRNNLDAARVLREDSARMRILRRRAGLS